MFVKEPTALYDSLSKTVSISKTVCDGACCVDAVWMATVPLGVIRDTPVRLRSTRMKCYLLLSWYDADSYSTCGYGTQMWMKHGLSCLCTTLWCEGCPKNSQTDRAGHVALAFEECSQEHGERVALARKHSGMEVLKGGHAKGGFIFDILINRKPTFTYGVEHDPMWLMATRIQKFHVEIDAEEVFTRACYFVATGYPYRYATYLDAMCPSLCSPGVRCSTKGGGWKGTAQPS